MACCKDQEFRIFTADADRADKLTLAAAFNYCQEAAADHARELGCGAEQLRESGMAWVLSRMSLALDERPGWMGRVVVRTWPRGWDRLFAIRGFQLLTPEGRVIGSGRSAWLLLRMDSLRPQRPSALGAPVPENLELPILEDGARAIERRTDTGAPMAFRAGYTDIDYNGHVNNARYIRWIQDALPMDALLRADALRLDINYLAETRQGDVALVSYAGAGDGKAPAFHVEGVLEASGTPSFRALLTVTRVGKAADQNR
jgi:medium-chain acyl-[acyl-carrier-protein] hydrolase